jgi:hypothetical protein
MSCIIPIKNIFNPCWNPILDIQKLSQLKEEYEKEDRLMCEYYVTECGGMTFHLPIRYQNIEPVGGGRFGCVVSVYDQVTRTKVAIKKISNLFERERSFQKRILRECKILRHLLKHENVCLSILLLLLAKILIDISNCDTVCGKDCTIDRFDFTTWI